MNQREAAASAALLSSISAQLHEATRMGATINGHPVAVVQPEWARSASKALEDLAQQMLGLVEKEPVRLTGT